MNVSYLWLRDYVDLKLSAADLAKLLPALGLQIEAVEPHGNDIIFNLEITANRPDQLSMLGVAREVAAATGAKLKLPLSALKEQGGRVSDKTSVTVEDAKLCPRYTARIISGAKIAESPAWLKEKLEAVGLRPVNNVVDITNFVMMECGQPLHAFDFDKLKGKKIIVRHAKAGEPITLIDGTEQKLTAEQLVIADAEVPTAVAGIMGGKATEISDSTQNILLESAQFLPANIRRTSRALGVASDSSYRFERGLDPRGVDYASLRAAALIQELAGGKVMEGVVDVGSVPAERKITVRPERVNLVLGVQIPPEKQKSLLEGIGFVSRGGDEFVVPSFRTDVSSEIDAIEEIARTFGYDNIPVQTKMRVQAVPLTGADPVYDMTRDYCIGAGYSEARTMSFVPEPWAARFTHWFAKPEVIRNPVNREEPALRTSIIPLLLKAHKNNQNHGADIVPMFELSRVYGSGDVNEKQSLTLIDPAGYASLRAAVDGLCAKLGITARVQYAEYKDANFAAGRSAKLTLDGAALGYAGEITQSLAKVFDMRDTPAVAELDFDILLGRAKLLRRFKALPKFPAIRRDLCVVVDNPVKWGEIEKAAVEAAGANVEGISFESEYRGKQIAEGRKAVAFSVTYRATDRTLTGEEVDEAMKRVAETMKAKLKAEMRA